MPLDKGNGRFNRTRKMFIDFRLIKKTVRIVPWKRASRITASGNNRRRFFPKSYTAPKVGISFFPWLIIRPSVLKIDGVGFRDTDAKNSEAARKSISSKLTSKQGCSSNDIFRDRLRIASIMSGPDRRFVDPTRIICKKILCLSRDLLLPILSIIKHSAPSV